MSNPNNDMLAEILRRGIIEGVNKLCEKHGTQLIDIMLDDPAEEMRIGLSVKFGYGAAIPHIEVGIRYGYSVSDKVVSRLPDPQQPEFVFDSVNDKADED